MVTRHWQSPICTSRRMPIVSCSLLKRQGTWCGRLNDKGLHHVRSVSPIKRRSIWALCECSWILYSSFPCIWFSINRLIHQPFVFCRYNVVLNNRLERRRVFFEQQTSRCRLQDTYIWALHSSCVPPGWIQAVDIGGPWASLLSKGRHVHQAGTRVDKSFLLLRYLSLGARAESWSTPSSHFDWSCLSSEQFHCNAFA